MSTSGQYNYDFGYGGAGDVSSGNETAGTDWGSIFTGLGNSLMSGLTQSTGSGINLGNLLGGGGVGAGLALGLGALAAALSPKPKTINMPKYVPAPVYDRALTAPMFPKQPPPSYPKSASGQNIYEPFHGAPLFFNPNPFQFDPTEAAKKYGPTPEQIAAGNNFYGAGITSLFQPLTPKPLEFVQKKEGGEINSPRYLNGDGDGMSDDIVATINGTQPARLADGEFVVPADVVADLGNGSSNAGAKRLHQMMKRIRDARHGTDKQPPQVDAEKVLPA